MNTSPSSHNTHGPIITTDKTYRHQHLQIQYEGRKISLSLSSVVDMRTVDYCI